VNSRTIGFDFDQTLADSKQGIAACLAEVCNHFMHAVDETRVDELAVSGLTLDLMLSALFDTEKIELQRGKFLELYPSLGVGGTRLMPGAKELLETTRARATCTPTCAYRPEHGL
jgi:phosphoglycolate phosphatase